MTDLFSAADAPTSEPAEIVAGTTVQWRKVDMPLYLTGFTFSYAFRPAVGGTAVVAAVSVVGSEFRCLMAAAVTALMVPGRYRWQSFLVRTADGYRVQYEDGETLVLSDLTATAGDTRSHAARMLTAIESIMEGKALSGGDIQNYTIGGRQINKMSPDELVKWRAYYRNEVADEQNAANRKSGKPTQNIITARFI